MGSYTNFFTTLEDFQKSKLDSFCTLPEKPLSFIKDYYEERGREYTLEEIQDILIKDYKNAVASGAVYRNESKLVFNSSFLQDDGSNIEVTLRKSKSPGKPMFLYYVGIDTSDTNIAEPGKALENFAFLGSSSMFCEELAKKAMPENWNFASVGEKQNSILYQYIKYAFYRLMREDKICIAKDKSLAAFNTGLFDSHYDDIFACFVPNDPSGESDWKFVSFCTAASGVYGKIIVDRFENLPEPASYFQSAEDLYFDTKRRILIDYEHIIVDNIDRLPLDYLKHVAYSSSDILETLSMFDELSGEEDGGTELCNKLRADLVKNVDIYLRIQSDIRYAVDFAVKRASRDYRIAVPIYFPKEDRTTLMLPLYLTNQLTPDIALVIDKKDSGNYQGQTILTKHQAYIDARLVGQLSTSWIANLNSSN